MSEILSEKQWQTLSAYLDGELTPTEKTALENQLETDPVLKKEYLSLFQTRRLLRDLPQKRIPRNFILTPEMVFKSSPAARFLFPTFSAASALAAFLFVMTLLVGRISTPASTFALQAPLTSKVELSTGGQSQITPTPMIIFWGNQAAEGKGGGGGGMEPGRAFSVPLESAPLASESTSSPEIAAMEHAAEQEPITGSGPILGVRESAQAPEVAIQPFIADEQLNEKMVTGPSPAQNQPIFQTILAGLAIVFGLSAWYFFRETRS